MEEQKTKYQPWTKEEMALLAHLMGVAFNAGKNQSEAAEFAATKLGRSKLACMGQYQNKMRGKSLSIWALPTEEPVEEQAEPATAGDHDIEKESNDTTNDMRITLHWGDSVHVAEVLINTGSVVVAKAMGVVITIEK
jgi:hypothetical protein